MTTVGALDEALIRAARSGGTVEIDLAEVDFIDGSGLSVLMDAESRARRANQELRIVAASSNVRRLIDFTDTADRTPRLAPRARRSAHAGRCDLAGQAPRTRLVVQCVNACRVLAPLTEWAGGEHTSHLADRAECRTDVVGELGVKALRRQRWEEGPLAG